jgi:hypothetical protein
MINPRSRYEGMISKALDGWRDSRKRDGQPRATSIAQ